MIEWSVVAVFLKLGLIGFGGGYAILSTMFNSIVPFGLISVEEFQNLIAISQITPGPVAINTATYVGYLSDGWPGAIICSIALCIPGMILMYIMALLLRKGKNMQILQHILDKVRIAGIVLLLTSGIFIADGTLVDSETLDPDILQICIFAMSFGLCIKFKPGPVKLIVSMGALSVAVGYLLEMII